MPNQTVTRAAESSVEADDLYRILTEIHNIPEWAPVFADSIVRIDEGHATITKNGESFDIEVVAHPSSRAVDYLREMPGNRHGGAYLRVTTRPLGGSSITMTVPLAPNAQETDVANTVDKELAALIELALKSKQPLA